MQQASTTHRTKEPLNSRAYLFLIKSKGRYLFPNKTLFVSKRREAYCSKKGHRSKHWASSVHTWLIPSNISDCLWSVDTKAPQEASNFTPSSLPLPWPPSVSSQELSRKHLQRPHKPRTWIEGRWEVAVGDKKRMIPLWILSCLLFQILKWHHHDWPHLATWPGLSHQK